MKIPLITRRRRLHARCDTGRRGRRPQRGAPALTSTDRRAIAAELRTVPNCRPAFQFARDLMSTP